MEYSIIPKSQLEGALRLDAEYYQPEYLEVAAIVASREHKTIKELSDKVFSGPFGSTLKSESYQESGIPFVRISNIADAFIDKQGLVYISSEEHRRIYSTHLKPGDIVFSKIGTIGRLSVISEDLGEVNISENNIGIRLSQLSPARQAYLFFFLLSKYGQDQILRKGSGNIQQKLNVADIEALRVPMVSEELEKGMLGFYEAVVSFRDQSKSLYSQAENLLLEELGLRDFEPDGELYNVANFSDITAAKRMDAEYFQAKYEKLIEAIKSRGAKSLLDILEIVPARFNPRSHSAKSFRYVELSNINSSIGIIDGFSEVLGKETPSRAKRVLKVGDVIVSSVEGSLGKVALVSKEQVNYLASTGFFQFRSRDILPEVMLVLAKSFVLQMQFEKQTAGTILTAVPKEAVKNIVVPRVTKPTQQKIANLVRQSHEARREAKQLLEEAKHKVEELIEKESK